MRVAQRHLHGAVPEQIADGIQWNAALDQARGEAMAQVVPSESNDPGASEKFRPRSSESRGDVENVSLAELLANCRTVDPLSLTLSLQHESDERVQMALNEFRKQFPW